MRKGGRPGGRCRLPVLLMCAGLAAGMCLAMATGEHDAGQGERAVSGRAWETVKDAMEQRIGAGYDEAGMCTGFVYWCLDEAYGVDWGTNSVVAALEDRLIAEGVTEVAKGSSGELTDDMRPGDIVIFAHGKARTHCAVLGEDGYLYHATGSSGVTYGPTLEGWMELPQESRNCDRYIIYRGLDVV